MDTTQELTLPISKQYCILGIIIVCSYYLLVFRTVSHFFNTAIMPRDVLISVKFCMSLYVVMMWVFVYLETVMYMLKVYFLTTCAITFVYVHIFVVLAAANLQNVNYQLHLDDSNGLGVHVFPYFLSFFLTKLTSYSEPLLCQVPAVFADSASYMTRDFKLLVFQPKVPANVCYWLSKFALLCSIIIQYASIFVIIDYIQFCNAKTLLIVSDEYGVIGFMQFVDGRWTRELMVEIIYEDEEEEEDGEEDDSSDEEEEEEF